MGPVKVVYDTNVLISGIGFGGTPWRCLIEVFVGDVEMVTSDAALAEFERVLGYDHLPFSPTEQDRFPELLRRQQPTTEVVGLFVDSRSADDVSEGV